jgi:hypothetical protein
MSTATNKGWKIEQVGEHGFYAIIWADDLNGDEGYAIVELIDGQLDTDRDGDPSPIDWYDDRKSALKGLAEYERDSRYQQITEKIEALLESADPDTAAGRKKLDMIAKALGL